MNNKKKKGSALLIVLFVTIIVGTLGAVVSLRSVNEARLVRRQTGSTQAFWLAEAGAQKAYYDITRNNCQGMRNATTQETCTACTTCGSGNMALSGTLAGGTYTVLVNAGATQLTSTGSWAPNAQTSALQRAVQAGIGGSSLFGFAAFSVGNMIFSNNALVDSYNSGAGDYGGTNKGSEGNIGTNSTSSGAITLSNNVTINGSASTGADGTITKSNGAIVTGGEAHDNSIILDPIVVPAVLQSADPGNALALENNETMTLTQPNYRFSLISTGNNATIVIDSNVSIYLTANPGLVTGTNCAIVINEDASLTLYADGQVIFSNNVLLNNLSRKPENFIIYSRYHGANGVSISNNGYFYGAIYAPDTDVILSNNANIYGAMVGKTITVDNNDQVHFDLALTALAAPYSAPTLSNWQEVEP